MNFDLKVFDPYNRRARVYPAVIAIAPIILSLVVLFSWDGFSLRNGFASAGVVVILYALSDIARRRGKRIEPKLFARLGGVPSERVLHWDDDTLDELSKERYLAFLAEKLGRRPPRADEEPSAANAFYKAAGNWLRERTRDKEKFNILFYDNISYGFRRNLLGLKSIAFFLDFLIILICSFLLHPWIGIVDVGDGVAFRELIVLGATVAHLVYFVFFVTWQAAGEAAESYGRQLIISIESFFNKNLQIFTISVDSRQLLAKYRKYYNKNNLPFWKFFGSFF